MHKILLHYLAEWGGGNFVVMHKTGLVWRSGEQEIGGKY
jgi:hypothetical protein